MSGYAGLCEACVNVRAVASRRGSRFLLCALSRTDPRFPKYPRLPVLSCAGFTPRPLDTDAPAADPVTGPGHDAGPDHDNGGAL
jgi:hypothetical protein